MGLAQGPQRSDTGEARTRDIFINIHEYANYLEYAN